MPEATDTLLVFLFQDASEGKHSLAHVSFVYQFKRLGFLKHFKRFGTHPDEDMYGGGRMVVVHTIWSVGGRLLARNYPCRPQPNGQHS